jgi:serine/threonine-protein kinase
MAAPGRVSFGIPSLDDDRFDSRYAWCAPLGEGGMGEVILYRDERIGREVAVKSIQARHGARSDLRARFLREACVQGQLEHPAIVPVYDLGVRPDGAVFFSMKRVRGSTLAQILDRLRGTEPRAAEHYTRRKLLGAFASVCLAVDFAHSHGVVHRDLKPDNVMLGDFGEVYVLDWGIAKFVDDAEAEAVAEAGGVSASSPVPDTSVDGGVVGTLGYMAPEQLAPKLGTVDARTDVYTLGAILFEILALEPLHRTVRVDEAVTSTLGSVDARPSVRAPTRDVPPELDGICVRATTVNKASRYASARELHDAVDRFLEGDRDIELRRALARKHADAAAEAAERALGHASDAAAHRSEALHELGRALAFDPENGPAMRTLVRLLIEPPKVIPPAVLERVHEARLVRTQPTVQMGSFVYLVGVLLLALLCILLRVHDWTWAVVAMALMAGAAVTSILISRRKLAPWTVPTVAAAGAIAIAAVSRFAGPFILLPAIVAGQAMIYTFYPARGSRVLSVVLACMSIVVPVALEWTGVLAPSYEFRGGAMIVVPRMVDLPPVATSVCIFLTTLASILLPVLVMAGLREEQFKAEMQLYVQSWQLEQLVPPAPKAPAS